MIDIYLMILIPIVLAAILHMLVVKFRLGESLTIPISKTYFGENKTWRGFAFLPLVNGLLTLLLNLGLDLLSDQGAFFTGFLLGAVYLLCELPNSWIKRRLGIAPGQAAQKNRWLFVLMDKSDSALGIALASSWIFGLSFWEGLGLFFLSVLIHTGFSLLLLMLKLKKSF